MSPFLQPEAAESAMARLQALTGKNVHEFLTAALSGVAAPDRALTNLERWLNVTSSPGMHMEQMMGLPRLGRELMVLLGASQPIADSIIQNPELASLLLEPGQLRRRPVRTEIVAEGQALLAHATSYTHALDRLRYLRQRWTLAIVLNDITGEWPPAAVWRAISDVADALLELAVSAVWAHHRAGRDLPEICPILVVGFGKLGGQELNYSSDVDLAYVMPDGTDDSLQRELTKFAEALGRALSDRMGRGSLYRVDLRLRPYGAAGSLVASARSVEAYYRLYAEPWEAQALLRSRPIVGPEDLAERWNAMRITTCFRPKLSELALDNMREMRVTIQHNADEDDLKRGPGGIRSVEFVAQILQILHGHDHPELQVLPTLDALQALQDAGLLEPAAAGILRSGYTFLRQLEHRVQLVHDQQTHQLPPPGPAREALAHLMDYESGKALDAALSACRHSLETLVVGILGVEAVSDETDRTAVSHALGGVAPTALQWFDRYTSAEEFYRALRFNRDSLERVRHVLRGAPALVADLQRSVALTEAVLSGELEETRPGDAASAIERLSPEAPIALVADTIRNARTADCLRWAFDTELDLGRALAELTDAVLGYLRARILAPFSVVATGSYGAFGMSLGSDADAVLLVAEGSDQPSAERRAQQLLGLIDQLRRHGAPIQMDLRLRPDGGRGLLVRSFEGFRQYELNGMEMWERFALGQARLVAGDEEALHLVQISAYGLPLTPERLKELVKMKRRIETERVAPQHVGRNVKLGAGGLSDIEWLIHLHEMRYPDSTRAGQRTDLVGRIRAVARARLLNALEAEILIEAHAFLVRVRHWLCLQGIADDLIPENPDRLLRLAQLLQLEDGNALLARYQDVTGTVRRLYVEGLDRLRA